ncbi:CAAX prenyl protease 2 [Chelonus insularis]|uniref:CAAX prenyl protease 2 n=1 Tax=Chelonus insularis TaxID=460826 RepID=UPI00158C38FE|nr:CAAX prenyl protease 2 [Chelonus insularis]
METIEQNNQSLCIYSISSCLLLTIIYVSSFYIWNSPLSRDHSNVIKKRFFSGFIMTLISPGFLYFGMSNKVLEKTTIWELLGLRWSGLLQATFIPLFLTMILFLGPLSMQGFNGEWKLYAELPYWIENTKSLIWWRNQIVAPFSEEWTFRACMMPLFLQCFHPYIAIFICPLFFGVAHFHHVFELTKMGVELKHAIIVSVFQFMYTTLFGAYAAFLFVKTGHFIAPFAAHSFCNHMGFPDLSEVRAYKDPLKKAGILCLFVIGFVAWYYLLIPLTNPTWFSNNLFWSKRVL